jgi:uncharacterized protein YqjF (DUF2071 family)
MKDYNNILEDTGNRYYPLPDKPWKYYQEWHDVLFMHWPVPVDIVQELLTNGLTVDIF